MKLRIYSVFLLSLFIITGCSRNQKNNSNNQLVPEDPEMESGEFQLKSVLDSYVPQKKSYNFYQLIRLLIRGGMLLPSV